MVKFFVVAFFYISFSIIFGKKIIENNNDSTKTKIILVLLNLITLISTYSMNN